MKTKTLKPGRQRLVSFETGDEYLIEALIGRGGFGVYKGRWIHLGKPMGPPVCIKSTVDVNSWHREAYFGEILRGHAGAVQMHSSFVGHQGPRRLPSTVRCSSCASAASVARLPTVFVGVR